MNVYVVTIHEMPNFAKSQKYATQMRECKILLKIRLELRLLSAAKQRGVFFLLNISELCGLFKLSLLRSAYVADNIKTTTAKKEEKCTHYISPRNFKSLHDEIKSSVQR